jgi:hypothetical protein
VSSDAKDTDITVKIIDVYPDGRAFNLDESIQRLRYRNGYDKPLVWMEKGKVAKVTLQPLVTSNFFQPGHRLRVEISSSSFPLYERNLNTGGNNYDESKGVIAHNAVHHSKEYPSSVVVTGGRSGARQRRGRVETRLFHRREDNGMTSPADGAGAGLRALHGETRVRQAPLELAIDTGRPDAEYATRPQCSAYRGHAGDIVQTRIGCDRQRGGAVVDVEEDGIERRLARSQDLPHVDRLDLDAGIIERMARQRAENTTVPLDDGGYEFGDQNTRVRRKRVERRTYREAHTEASQQHVGTHQCSCALAAKDGKRFLRGRRAARHEALTVRENGELARMANKGQLRTIRCGRAAEHLPRFHEDRIVAEGPDGVAPAISPRTPAWLRASSARA